MKIRVLGTVLVLLLPVACGDDGPQAIDSPEATEVEEAVRAYSVAFLTADAEAAHEGLSERCREVLSVEQLEPIVDGAAEAFGGAEVTSVAVSEVSGDDAVVTYSYEDAPDIDRNDQPWVREDGDWRNDDC